jgi:uncharacterized protein YxeA
MRDVRFELLLLLLAFSLILVVVVVVVVAVITVIEMSLGGISPYTSTDKSNKNKYT